MSDYLQRLVNRAIPAPNFGQAKLPEVKPAMHVYGNTPGDQQSDFDNGMEALDQATKMGWPVSTDSLVPELQPSPAVNQTGQTASLTKAGASENSPLRSNPETAQIFEDRPGPDRSDLQTVGTVSNQQLPALNFRSSLRAERMIAAGEQPVNLVYSQATESRQEEISPISENSRPFPLNAAEHIPISPFNPAEPELQFAARMPVIIAKQSAEITGTPQLEPQVPVVPEAGLSRSEPERLVIGSLTVEVLPAAPTTKATQQVVQVTQILPAAPPRHSRSSKLRFGLGQM